MKKKVVRVEVKAPYKYVLVTCNKKAMYQALGFPNMQLFSDAIYSCGKQKIACLALTKKEALTLGVKPEVVCLGYAKDSSKEEKQ